MKIYSREERQALVDERRITFDEMRDLQLANIEDMLITLTKKKKRKPQQRKSEYPKWFEDAWKAYPKRAGSNPKLQAYRAANARIDDCYSDEVKTIDKVMLDGVNRYAAFCKATGKVNTELVMQAQRFFGPSKEYLNDWSIPTKSKVPADNYEMQAWAIKRGLRLANVGESWSQYRAYVESES